MRKILLLILVLFISVMAGNAQTYSGISAVLPPVIWVPSVPLNLRPSVFRQIHSALLSDSHGHQLRYPKQVMSVLSNYGGSVMYDYSVEQYRNIAHQLGVNTLYQAEIFEFQLQTVTYRTKKNNGTYKKYRMHINMALNRIDASDGTPRQIGIINQDYISDDSELFPPSQAPFTINSFSDRALIEAVRLLINNVAKPNISQ